MLSRAENTFHHNPRLRGPVSSIYSSYILHISISTSKDIKVYFIMTVKRSAAHLLSYECNPYITSAKPMALSPLRSMRT